MNTKRPMWIMVAGPYRSGASSDREYRDNLDALNKAALEIHNKGHIPIIGVDLALPIIQIAGEQRYDEIMMPVSLALADRCDAALRVGGPSSGADAEVERIRLLGGLSYTDVNEIPSFTGPKFAPTPAATD